MEKRIEKIVLSLIIIAAICLAWLNRSKLVDFLAYDCERMAQSMQTNYYYHPSDGCFLQQPNGEWRQVLRPNP